MYRYLVYDSTDFVSKYPQKGLHETKALNYQKESHLQVFG